MYTTETQSNFNNDTNIKKFDTILFESVITFWKSDISCKNANIYLPSISIPYLNKIFHI